MPSGYVGCACLGAPASTMTMPRVNSSIRLPMRNQDASRYLLLSQKKWPKMPKMIEKEPKSFEAATAELDALVEKMEAGQLPLEESLVAYQRGTELLRYCERVLADAEQRIQVLTSAADGTTSLKDLAE